MPRPLRSPDADRLAEWQRRSGLAIVLAALAPILLSLGDAHDGVIATVGVLSWLVFLADLLVRRHLRPGYLRTGWGRVDLAIVALTAPWFLLPGLADTRFLGLVRLGRVARVLVASRNLRALAQRINRVAIVSASVIAGCAFVALRAEAPHNGFDDYGDALWWAIVTTTTVGYGDIVPITVVGRLAGVVLMVAGVGILGVLAGSLASFFRTPDEEREQLSRDRAPVPPDPAIGEQLGRLTRQVEELNRRLTALGAGKEPPAGPS